MSTWTDEDTEKWMNDYPLPADFSWKGEKAWPRYTLKNGYGQWLRTAGSYHPALRGLWRSICELLQEWPVGKDMPTPEEMVYELRARETMGGLLEVDDDAPALGRGVDFAAKLKRNQPPGSPA